MPASPRVVIAAPLYEKAEFLPRALDSILGQTFSDFALLLIDDRSADETLAIAQRYAAHDPRVHVEVNAERLGMLGNTRKAWWRAREQFPRAEYWALGSDHDLWHPRFLEALVGALDAHPEAVLAYPDPDRIDAEDRIVPGAKRPTPFTTLGVVDPVKRLQVSFRRMAAGSMIYGLFRASALGRVSFYRPVLIPDRILLSELALHGPFVHVPEALWQRRFRGLAELERQRRVFFLDGVPAYAKLPWWLQHAGAIALTYGVRGEGRALGMDRAAGLRLAGVYLGLALAHRGRRRWARAIRWVRRWLTPARIARRLVNSTLARYGPDLGERARERLTRLETGVMGRLVTKRVLRPALERLAARLNGPTASVGGSPGAPSR